MPLTGDYNTDRIDRKYHRYNELHPDLWRLDDATFLTRFEGRTPGLIAAQMVQLYIGHNIRLHDATRRVTDVPFGYTTFATSMANQAGSAYSWAYYSTSEECVKYLTPGARPPSFDNFLVMDSDIEPRDFIRPGHVQVAVEWYEEVLAIEQRRRVARLKRIAESRDSKKSWAGLSKVNSEENQVALARRIARDEEEYQRSLTAKRKRVEDKEEGEIAGTSAPAAVDTTVTPPVVTPPVNTNSGTVAPLLLPFPNATVAPAAGPSNHALVGPSTSMSSTPASHRDGAPSTVGTPSTVRLGSPYDSDNGNFNADPSYMDNDTFNQYLDTNFPVQDPGLFASGSGVDSHMADANA
ncbi:hypothetical protein B0H13DRAFT_2557674 [Mycena leptocephala]|nr:hypothetical protein B0H13DRAFT_2557674 [Mycena leptocephala]